MSSEVALPLPFPHPQQACSEQMVGSPTWLNIYNRTPNQVFPSSPKTPPFVPKQTPVSVANPSTVQYFQFPPTPMTPCHSPIPSSSPSCQVSCSSPSIFNFPDHTNFRHQAECAPALPSPRASPPQMYHQLHQNSPPQIHQTPHQIHQTSPQIYQMQTTPPQMQTTPPQMQTTPPQMQTTPPQIQQFQSSVTHVELPPHLQTPPSLQSRLPVQQTTSSYEQTTPPHGQRDHTPHHMPATSTVPSQLTTTALPAFHTPPPPFMPNLSYQQGAAEQRNLRANDYASFLLQQCNTSLTDLPQSFVKNSLPFLQQARNTQQQLQYPLPQMPGNTPAPVSQPYYATGAPYGSLVYVTHGKVKPRKRTAFTETQQAQLEDAFERKNYISTAERVKLSLEIRLSVHTILLWYQNKRARLKKKGINSKRSE